MVDLPVGGEGLSWIASRDPTQLLLITGLQPSSIAAAAAGDHQALAYVRLTAQHYAAYAGAHIISPLDRACLAACKVKSAVAYDHFLRMLKREDAALAGVFEARQAHGRKLLEATASEGQVSPLKWIRAICHPTYSLKSAKLMSCAAAHGHLEVLKYLRSGPSPEEWSREIPIKAKAHLDCMKWLLSTDSPGGPCPHYHCILSDVARCHDLPALQWFRAKGELPAALWDEHVVETAVRKGDRPMLEWLRGLVPPVPWNSRAVAAASSNGDIDTLRWLRAQDPPCPWDQVACCSAAYSNRQESLVWLRSQNPPCPWKGCCTEDAAKVSSLELLQWLHANGCPWGDQTAQAAIQQGNMPILKWFHSAGCPFGPDAMHTAALWGRLQVLTWLCDQVGRQLTGQLYLEAARGDHCHILKFLHGMNVPLGGADQGITNWDLLDRAQTTTLMFLADIGVQLPVEMRRKVMQARRAHCTFHGLIRWCRRAVSDPSRGAHRAFDSLAADGSGQMLLTRLCLLPPELVSKIAVMAQLQHDIFDPSARQMQ